MKTNNPFHVGGVLLKNIKKMSSMDCTTLDVYFRGQRPYIQGSLILSETAKWLEESIGGNKKIALVSAKFESIVDVGVCASIDSKKTKKTFGEAGFQIDGITRTVYFHIDQEIIPPRIADRPTLLISIKNEGGLNGEAFFNFEGSFDNFLGSVVEASKQLHQNYAPRVYDIWFSGIRKAMIPIAGKLLPETGSFRFEEIMQHRKRNQYQSLSKVYVFNDDSEQLMHEFLWTFAYKIDENINGVGL